MQPDAQTLVILTPGFPKNEADTTCLPLQQALVKTISRQYPQLKVVVLAFKYPFKPGRYNWHELPVQAFAGKDWLKLLKVYNWIKVWRALKKLKRTQRIAGILSFWLGECALVGEYFAKAHHLKHYCWILGQDAKPLNPYLTLMNADGDSLIALSGFISESMTKNYGITLRHIIPGGIDGSKFKQRYEERTIDILGVGSLICLKQYHLFIEVVCRLRHRFPRIKAVLCGEGPDRARLTGMIQKLHMEDHITLLGEVPHPQVLELMARSKVLVHTSNYEGLGMVCLEALYAGAKVISLVRPLQQPIPNWYIAANTVEMTDIATRILRNPDTKYQQTAPYLIEDIAAQMVELYLDKPPAISLKRPAMAVKESVEW
jgi:glycosyltransferase involved in cell wall biosynthesis